MRKNNGWSLLKSIRKCSGRERASIFCNKIWPFLKANDHFCKAGLYVFDDQIPSVIGLIPVTKEFMVYESIFKLQEK
jgi:hypothetical protein